MATRKFKIRKKNREIIVSLFSFLPLEKQIAIDSWLRGRKEYREIKKADFVIVSPPKCGRTWLRVMLSRLLQLRYNLPEGELLGFDNYYRLNAAAPRIRFTHDRYVSAYTRNFASKRDFYDKKVILLVRDPRDIAVSNYFQWKNCANPFKRKLRKVPENTDCVPLFEYAMGQQFGIPRTVSFLNGWASELDKTRAHLLVRYEDMRSDSENVLRAIASFMELDTSDEQIRQVVEFAAFDQMKAMEQNQAFDSTSRRLMLKDPNNPDAFKVRRGKVGGYRDYFSPHDLAAVDHFVYSNLSPDYGYVSLPEHDGLTNAEEPSDQPASVGQFYRSE